MMTIQDFIKIGMIRDVNQLVSSDWGLELNLGAGEKPIDGTIPLDLPEWNADFDAIPYSDKSVQGIWALHFLEHVIYPIAVLKECQRVLVPGGVMNIVVPYYTSNLHHSDLDHKHTFSENTFKQLFRQKEYYAKGQEDFEWDFKINFSLIIGVEEKNLALYTQLVRGKS